VSEEDGPRRQLLDDLRVVAGDLIDTAVGQCVRVRAGRFDGVRVAGPAGRDWLVAGIAEQLYPGCPLSGVEPQTVDEDDGSPVGGHDGEILSMR
jgi:hypothetical protein